MLCDIRTGAWDEDLCGIFGISARHSPEITDTAGARRGRVQILGSPVPVAVVGDSRARFSARRASRVGTRQATFGTGLFVVCNAGPRVPGSETLHGRVAYRGNGPTRSKEALSWREPPSSGCATARLLGRRRVRAIARSVLDNGGVYFVPALSPAQHRTGTPRRGRLHPG